MTPPNDKEKLEQAISRAEATLAKLCSGEKWTLHIPVNKADPDVVFGTLIRLAKQLTAQLADRDALIVRQGEMLERAFKAALAASLQLDVPMSLRDEFAAQANLQNAAQFLKMALATLQINGTAKTAGDGEG